MGSMCGRSVRHIRLAEISEYTGFFGHLKASTPANMNCQYCRKVFTSDYNLRRHEDEYCPDRDRDGKECSPPKKSRDADEASILSNESMGTHASHDDNDEDTKMEAVLKTVLTRKTIPGLH